MVSYTEIMRNSHKAEVSGTGWKREISEGEGLLFESLSELIIMSEDTVHTHTHTSSSLGT